MRRPAGPGRHGAGPRSARRGRQLAAASAASSVYRGDVREPASLTAGRATATDAVLHLAAMMDVWRPMRGLPGRQRDRHARTCAGPRWPRVSAVSCHMSSSSVYGMALGRPADESFPLAPFADPYPVTKAAGDRLVQRMIDDGAPAGRDHPPGPDLRARRSAALRAHGRPAARRARHPGRLGRQRHAVGLRRRRGAGTAARPGPRSRARPGLQHHQRPAADPEAAAVRDRRGNRGQPAAHPGALPRPVRSRVPGRARGDGRRRP